MPNNWYEPDTIPKFCYFTYFKTYPLLSEPCNKILPIKLEKFKALQWAVQGDILGNLLKPAIPSTG